MKPSGLLVGLVGIALEACSGATASPSGASQGASDNLDAGMSANADSGVSGSLDAGGSAGDFCAVQALLESRCQSCHSDPPLLGVPMALMTPDELLAPAVTDPSKRAVDVSIARMQNTTLPMPPAPASPPTSDEVAVLQQWVDEGMPTTCDGATPASGNPYDTPLTCSSDSYTRGGGSANMSPGRACMSCHGSSSGLLSFELAGTVYPSAHEPNDCNGVNGTTGGAQVMVIDASGATITLNVSSDGNFYSVASFEAPYTAKVVQDGLERVMVTPQQSGDCNSCHSESGANQAPGRIMLP